MKCSELIEMLRDMQKTHGDCDIRINGSVRLREDDGDFVLDSNCRYSYEELPFLYVCSVSHENDEIIINVDDFK
jgi:hypothetical protein